MTLTVPPFERATVLVCGDVMLDRYWLGSTARISPEAPVPVVRVESVDERPGGAANVAVNLAGLGARTRLVGVTGDDDPADRLESLLEAAGVDSRLQRQAGGSTITKLRVVSRNQQLVRLDFESGRQAGAAALAARGFADALGGVDAVVLSDYGKGALGMVQGMIRDCRAAGVPVLVDPKGADFERYRGATALTPNQAELEVVVGPCPDEATLESKGRELAAGLGVEYLMVTRGDRGMLVITEADVIRLPARAKEVFDVTGAGDTVVAVAAAAAALGLPVATAAGLANLAGGVVVGKLGAAFVTPAELAHALHADGKGGRGLVTEEQLVTLAADARRRGERIVMTNGCFDLLHAGHVAYLEEAKSLGDRLVVAVNDDASVGRLKGPGRPVNPLADRMAVLAGLAAVDWVVAFEDDTPASLIARVCPDVLVKGGDYRPEEVAGADAVTNAGGEVRILAFREGRSTSGTIRRIRGT